MGWSRKLQNSLYHLATCWKLFLKYSDNIIFSLHNVRTCAHFFFFPVPRLQKFTAPNPPPAQKKTHPSQCVCSFHKVPHFEEGSLRGLCQCELCDSFDGNFMEHFPFYSVAGSEVVLHLLDLEELAASRGNLQRPDRCLFRNFLMDPYWPASLGRFRQFSPGWRHYFKKLLKLQPKCINVVTHCAQKIFFWLLLGDFK